MDAVFLNEGQLKALRTKHCTTPVHNLVLQTVSIKITVCNEHLVFLINEVWKYIRELIYFSTEMRT